MINVKDLKDGSIVWHNNTIVGVKGFTIESVFGKLLDEAVVFKIGGKPFDYEIIYESASQEAKAIIDKLVAESEDL